MSIEQQVNDAPTPREALSILARAVDRLLAAPTVDSWDGWGPENPTTKSVYLEPTPPERAIELLREDDPPAKHLTEEDVIAWIGANYGMIPDDNAEARAVIAQVRRDLENAGTPEVDGDIFQVHDGVVESSIDWSPHDEAHAEARKRFAREQLKLDVALGAHPEGGDWAEDYAKQGPMPLYLFNRELLLQYPDAVKAALIKDVEGYNVRVSQEMGRDLLKRPLQPGINAATQAGIMADRENGLPDL